MADQDADKKPLDDSELPGEEALDEEPDESTEAEDEEFEGDAAAVAAASGSHRFGFGRGHHEDDTVGQHSRQHMGSVRETHERVQISDVPSAVYALLCAGALLGILVIALIGNVLPQPAGPQLTPLVVPTGLATPVASATAPSGNATAAATATAAPTASPVASATPAASPSK